ncbi:hypothetical protein [Rubinisphaera italica]|uniref:Uncharacterized protein n=1 Tax=Rubinisphaera italica TaxID=2527969 RepID=A0A5C5XDV1_9PLAN|nr:hypothetical protein [Rubinisphaera italica]TWT60964.1 hypothetical protein Pan54_16960 [Rubinisphaera italica]
MVWKRPALQGGDLYYLAESGTVGVSISSPTTLWHAMKAIPLIPTPRDNLIGADGSQSDPKAKRSGIART